MTSPTDGARAQTTDYALSAGWGALRGAVLVAARDKGDEPVRSAEVPALGLATFALSKLVAKEKVDAWVREPFVKSTRTAGAPRARACATRSASC
jgi:hypothetical protein